jgi:MFS family permease
MPETLLFAAASHLQGAVAAAFSSTGSGMLADIIPQQHRGTAMGIANIPMFIGGWPAMQSCKLHVP